MQNYGQVIHNLEDRAALYMTTDIALFGCSAIYIVKKKHISFTFNIYIHDHNIYIYEHFSLQIW